MARRFRIGVIIVNYKTVSLTLSCVETLVPQLDTGIDRIVVVDNHSGPEDVTTLKKAFSVPKYSPLVTILPRNSNDGFSAGNNAGIQSLETEFYLLTNSDTLFHAAAISELLSAAEKYPEAGIISPRLEWLSGEAQVSCFREHSPLSELIRAAHTGPITSLLRKFNVPIPPKEHPSTPEWTSFACVLVRKEVFRRVGLMDDGYFMYYEDTDFCKRARENGFGILNWPSARVVHLQGQSSDVDKLAMSKDRLPDYYYLSRSRFYRKFHGTIGFLLANLCWLAGRSISLLRQVLQGMNQPVPQAESFNIWKSSPVERFKKAFRE